MFNVRLAGDHLYSVHLAVAGNVFDGVFLYYPFSPRDVSMKSGTELSQFLRIFLPIFQHVCLTPIIRYLLRIIN